jgi:hypothetical protein
LGPPPGGRPLGTLPGPSRGRSGRPPRRSFWHPGRRVGSPGSSPRGGRPRGRAHREVRTPPGGSKWLPGPPRGPFPAHYYPLFGRDLALRGEKTHPAPFAKVVQHIAVRCDSISNPLNLSPNTNLYSPLIPYLSRPHPISQIRILDLAASAVVFSPRRVLRYGAPDCLFCSKTRTSLSKTDFHPPNRQTG